MKASSIRRSFYLLLLLGTLGCGAGCVEPQSGEFAIYLTAADLAVAEIDRIDLDQVELESSPILSSADIVSYLKDTHEMTLTEEAAQRIEVPARWERELGERGVRDLAGSVGVIEPVIGEEPAAHRTRLIEPRIGLRE